VRVWPQEGDLRHLDLDAEDAETMRQWKQRQADLEAELPPHASFTDSPSHSRYWDASGTSTCAAPQAC
jgi:hypothetical protein